jgi:hypothetical protein
MHIDTRWLCIIVNVHTWTAVFFFKAPCEYVLHGLVPGIGWTPFWPLLMSMHLVATPNPVSSCLLQRFKFHPNVFCYLGGFSRMYKQTSQQRYTIQSTHVYIVHVLLFIFFFLHFFHFPGQAGCPPFPLSVTLRPPCKNRYFSNFCTLKLF